MVARPSAPFRSAHAGEFSSSAAGRVDIKQYYSAGLAFKNVEPVPQGGFRQMGGSRRTGIWRAPLAARAITSPSTSAGPHTGTQTVWTGTVAGTVAAVLVTGFEISDGQATFTVEAQIGGVWIVLGGPFSVNPEAAETRLAASAPGSQAVATALRIRATFSTSSTVAVAAVAAYFEDGAALSPRFVTLTSDDAVTYVGFVTAGIADFFTEAGHCGAAWLPDVTQAMLPDLDFYAEGNTIGVFHGALETVRIFRVPAGQGCDWRVDAWPYDALPVADLGGDYAKTDDLWEIFLRFPSDGDEYMYVSITVDGESTDAVPLRDISGNPCTIASNQIDWSRLALDLQTELRGLPSLGNGAGVVDGALPGNNRKLTVSFSDELSGREYQVSATITNTAAMSALPVHSQVGDTELEPLWSPTRGWPGSADLAQDRLVHARNPAVSGAIAMSQIGEYFTFNTKVQGDNGARLDKIRSQTSETILAAKESQYLLVFSDRGAYFVPNRTIERNTPLNFVKASETGMQPNCKPFDLEGVDYYVAINPEGLDHAADGGRQLLKIVYDDVSTRYNATPVSLLATHLVDRIVRSCRQRPLNDLDAAKGWLMRTDGRLIAGQFIDSQDILGFCEWIAAAGGRVREIGIDGRNRLWLAVERSGRLTIELYDMACVLQDAVAAEPDLAGAVTGLPYEDGAVLWAVADGYVIGPFAAAGGAIDLEDSYSDVVIGRWQAPRFESMPQVMVLPSDDVIWRPGRIHTAHMNVIETTSLAIGANGEPAQEVALTRAGDPADAPPPPRSELVTVAGLTGAMDGPTLVITQTKPGALRARDYSIGAKL